MTMLVKCLGGSTKLKSPGTAVDSVGTVVDLFRRLASVRRP